MAVVFRDQNALRRTKKCVFSWQVTYYSWAVIGFG